MTASGATRLVEALERLGVTTAFGLPGVHNLPIWKALAASPIRLVGVRHEQAAVYAADGYARATGRLGVALVTSGPGAANALGATGEAMASGSSVLVVATDVPSALRRPGVYRGILHETRDQTAMFVPVTKDAALVGAADGIGTQLLAAGRRALAAPSGPVYVGVPTDLLLRDAGPLSEPPAPPPCDADGEALDRAAGLLAGAAHPLIWAGGGAVRSGAGEAVGALAERLAAPVVTTFQGRGLLAPEHPCAVPGPIHAEEIGMLWDEADVVLAIGTDFDGMMTQNWLMPAPPALIAINVDEREAGKNYPADVALVGDAARVVDALLPRVAPRPGLPALQLRMRGLSKDVAASVAADEPQATAMLDAMARCLPADAVVVADMCIPGYWLAGYRQVPAPRRLAYPVGWGTLGFAFPASLGAALAGVGPTVCVTGDGGFLFACGELATAVQDEIPVTVVLVDDGGYGMLRFDQEHAGDEPFGVDLARPDFAALAESFGVPATTVDGFAEPFAATFAAGIAAAGPRMIVVNARMKPPPTTSPRWYRRR